MYCQLTVSTEASASARHNLLSWDTYITQSVAQMCAFLAEMQPARGKQMQTGWALWVGVRAGRRHQGTAGVSPRHGAQAACAGPTSGPDAARSCQGASIIILCPSAVCLRGRPWGWHRQPLLPCAFRSSPPGLPVEVGGREEGEVGVPIVRVPPLAGHRGSVATAPARRFFLHVPPPPSFSPRPALDTALSFLSFLLTSPLC